MLKNKVILRISAVVLALSFCALTGCGKDPETTADSSSVISKVQSAASKRQSASEQASSPEEGTSDVTASENTSAESPRTSSAAESSKPNSGSTSSKPISGGTINSVETIINDMKGKHEGLPHGVPLSYSWSQKPRVGYGIDPGDFQAFTAWGQVYEDKNGNPATNTRVQLRKMQAYYYSKSQKKWIELQNSSSIAGSAFREDFKNNANTTPDVRDEPSNGGGISVTAGGGYNYHFWPKGERASIDAKDILAIYSTVQARLIVGDPNKADDRSKAKYLLSMGGDYWRTKTNQWDNLTTNGDYAIGKFKYVTTEWQAFNAWAGDENLIRKNPPPFE